MAEYDYQGVDRTGKKVNGTLSAQSEGEVRMALRGQGVRPTRISAQGVLNRDIGSLLKGKGHSLTLQQQVIFTRQLQVLLGSGIPLVQGLDILWEQTGDRSLKTILGAIKERVSQGSYFWEALALYPKAFPKIYVSLIRAGEASGSMEIILKRLTRYLEDAERLRKMIKGAMTYPVVVLLIGAGVIGGMLAFVIPKFEGLLKGAGQQLPAPTQFLIDASRLVTTNFVPLAAGLVIGGYLVFRFLSTPEGRALRDRALFRAPLFGPMMQKGGVARFSRTMQTLLGSGVNLIDAIEIVKSTIDNVVLEEAVAKIRAEVESGKTLGMTVTKMPVFPRMAVQMISVGESTGNLDKMLEKVADFYEAEVESTVAAMSKLIEPLVLVVLGGAVAAMMIAMYLPIFKLGGGAGE